MVNNLTYPRVLLSISISLEDRQAPIWAAMSAACWVHQKQNLRHWESPPGHLLDRRVYQPLYYGGFSIHARRHNLHFTTIKQHLLPAPSSPHC